MRTWQKVLGSVAVLLWTAVASGQFVPGEIPDGGIVGPPVIIVVSPSGDFEDPAMYSIEDATAELGAEFALAVTISSSEEVSFTTVHVEVDSDRIHITDWAPGAALAAYIEENGEIPCDVVLTCSTLDVFMSFPTPFDVEAFGSEFIDVDCLVVAQEEGTTVASVSNLPGSDADEATITLSGGTALESVPDCDVLLPFPTIEDPATYSAGDITVELGAEFTLSVDATASESLTFSSVRVEVDLGALQIVDWAPGAGLQAYLDANGPIACDAFLTCSQLDVVMLFPVPFDTAEFGSEFLSVECLAIAPAEGDTTVTVSNSTSGASDEATVTLSGGTAIDPVPDCDIELPVPIDVEEADYSIADTSAPIGGEFELSVSATAKEPIFFIDFEVSVDPEALSITEVVHGDGLAAYIEEHGPVAAELVFQDASRATVLFFFDDALDTELYGADIVRIAGSVTAKEVGDTTVEIANFLGEAATATVSIERAGTIVKLGITDVIRGDVDADGDCTIVDAIRILDRIFAGGTVHCDDAADMDDDGALTIVDPIRLLTALFISEEPLDESCKADSTADSLSCDLSGC